MDYLDKLNMDNRGYTEYHSYILPLGHTFLNSVWILYICIVFDNA